MFIDIGVASKEEAEQAGVALGDMITPYTEFTEMANENYLLAKAWDNRFGVALSIDVMKNLEKENININLVSGATVQEEVGLRGAKVAANKVKPDLAIAVDVGLAMDTPGMKSSNGTGDLGKGPLVLLMDGSNIGHVPFRKHILDVAKRRIFLYSVITAARTRRLHIKRRRAVCMASPRYTCIQTHKEDYNNAVKLVTE